MKALFPIVSDQKNIHGITIFLKMLLASKKKLSLDPASRRIERRILKKEWQDTILELFRYSADFFFYTDTDALLIEQKIVIILMLLRSMVFFYL